MDPKAPIQNSVDICRAAGIEVINPAMQEVRLKQERHNGFVNGLIAGICLTVAVASVLFVVVLSLVLV